MSVIVKGIKMPKTCGECRFSVDGWCYAFASNEKQPGYIRSDEKAKWCPLVEVPPHGDLIGREWLIDIALHLMNTAKNDDIANGVKWMWQYIIESPTIISADKDGET